MKMKSYQIHRDPPRKSDPDEKLGWWWVIPIVAFIGMIIGLTFIPFYQLPEPINETSNNESFIASRAKKDLEEFVAIGPKVVGGIANEQITVKYLIDKITEIQDESIGLYNIEVDTQVASGGFLRADFVNLYEKIQNVIVKITPKISSRQNSVLVNCHFDTVPDSPGAGDDGSMVVVMLGVLSTLTKSKDVVSSPIVFLFNGAEENGLQGSHAFITQHKWATNVSAFLNLDATGTGGKEILFQTGPNSPWIVDLYAKAAKYPYASVIGEEIFENELIPSDTDFRIFRDYGKIPGLDLAYAYNDYVYHTKYDDIDVIEDGTYQHTGDNVLGIVRSLANADELEQSSKDRSEGKAVFFDVFGIFMISYTETTGIIVNVVLSAVAIVTMAVSVFLMRKDAAVSTWDIHKQYGLALCVQLVSLILAAGVVVLIAVIVDAINYSLSWFSQPWLIFGLYFIPFILMMGIFPALFLQWKKFNSLPLRYRITLFLHAHCSILVVMEVVLVCLSIRTAFFVSQLLLFYTLALIINSVTKWYKRNHIWIVPIIISQAIPLAFISYIMIITYSLFIPINGRSGAKNNPELIIALFAIVYTYLMFGFFIPILCIFRKTKSMLLALLIVMLIFVILMFTSVCFPYRAKTSPQRQALLHTKRIMYDFEGKVRNEDAGFYAITWDRQSTHTLKEITERLNLKERDAGKDCNKELFCGLPLYHPVMITYLSTGFWIDSDPPNIQNMPSIVLKSKELRNGQIYRYTFEMTGTKQNEILLKANSGIDLTGWSFETTDVPVFDKEEYFIHLRFGLERLPYSFYLDLHVNDISAPAVVVGHVGHFQSDENVATESLKKLMSEFPDWVFVQGVEATYQSWQF